MEMPEWQVHEYNAEPFILRQSGCTDDEMPFLYLFFGKDRGLLWDTGSRNGDLAPTLQRVVHNGSSVTIAPVFPLVVTHSHSHEDHTWGDAALQALNDPSMPIQFVAPTVDAAILNLHDLSVAHRHRQNRPWRPRPQHRSDPGP